MTIAAPVFETPVRRRPGEPLRVLIVDDDRDIAESLRDAVIDLGDRGEVSHTGNQAMLRVLSCEPDVLLLDLSLPDTSGLRIAEMIRALKRPKTPKIIAVTGHSDPQTKRATAAAGFDLHLTKPIRFEVLESMLYLLRQAPVIA